MLAMIIADGAAGEIPDVVEVYPWVEFTFESAVEYLKLSAVPRHGAADARHQQDEDERIAAAEVMIRNLVEVITTRDSFIREHSQNSSDADSPNVVHERLFYKTRQTDGGDGDDGVSKNAVGNLKLTPWASLTGLSPEVLAAALAAMTHEQIAALADEVASMSPEDREATFTAWADGLVLMSPEDRERTMAALADRRAALAD